MRTIYNSGFTLHAQHRDFLNTCRRDSGHGQDTLESYAQNARLRSRLKRNFDAHKRVPESCAVAAAPTVRAGAEIVYLPGPVLTASNTPIEPEERNNVIRAAFG